MQGLYFDANGDNKLKSLYRHTRSGDNKHKATIMETNQTNNRKDWSMAKRDDTKRKEKLMKELVGKMLELSRNIPVKQPKEKSPTKPK